MIERKFTRKEKLSAELSNLDYIKRIKYKGNKRALKEIKHFEETGYLTKDARRRAVAFLRRKEASI